MPREEPFCKKCCFCIPLQTCLQACSSIKAIANILLAGYLAFLVIFLAPYNKLYENHFNIFHMFIIVVIALAIDSAFMVVLAVGLCTTNLRTLRVALYYSMLSVCMGAICAIGFLIYIFVSSCTEDEEALAVMCIVSGFFNTALGVCIIFTLKSEMIKLRNKQQYEFFEMPTLDKEEGEPKEPAETFRADADN